VNHLIEVLQDASAHWSVQMTAAIELRGFANAASERDLLDTIEHNGNYLVRYHSSISLQILQSRQNGVVAADKQTYLSEDTVQPEHVKGKFQQSNEVNFVTEDVQY